LIDFFIVKQYVRVAQMHGIACASLPSRPKIANVSMPSLYEWSHPQLMNRHKTL